MHIGIYDVACGQRQALQPTGTLGPVCNICIIFSDFDGNNLPEIVTVTADLGNNSDLPTVEKRALSTGARKAHIIDGKSEFIEQKIDSDLIDDKLYALEKEYLDDYFRFKDVLVGIIWLMRCQRFFFHERKLGLLLLSLY